MKKVLVLGLITLVFGLFGCGGGGGSENTDEALKGAQAVMALMSVDSAEEDSFNLNESEETNKLPFLFALISEARENNVLCANWPSNQSVTSNDPDAPLQRVSGGGHKVVNCKFEVHNLKRNKFKQCNTLSINWTFSDESTVLETIDQVELDNFNQSSHIDYSTDLETFFCSESRIPGGHLPEDVFDCYVNYPCEEEYELETVTLNEYAYPAPSCIKSVTIDGTVNNKYNGTLDLSFEMEDGSTISVPNCEININYDLGYTNMTGTVCDFDISNVDDICTII